MTTPPGPLSVISPSVAGLTDLQLNGASSAEQSERLETRMENSKQNENAPINQLPVELLLDIFNKICGAEGGLCILKGYMQKRVTPLVLGAVCDHWRQIVWASPFLWDHICLLLSRNELRYLSQVELLRVWLKRSGDVPLFLNLSLEEGEEDDEWIPTALLDLFIECAPRWNAIAWMLPETWYPTLNSMKGKLINLQKICAEAMGMTARTSLTFLDNAPMLERAHLNGYYISDLILQWPRLTNVTMANLYIDECYDLFQQSPNLVRCNITLAHNNVGRDVEKPSSPLLLDKMQQIYLDAYMWSDVLLLLEDLSLPILETIDLRGDEGNCSMHRMSNLIQLAIVGGIGELSSLSTLTIYDITFTKRFGDGSKRMDQELKYVLTQLPSLHTLDLQPRCVRVGDGVGFCPWWFLDFLKAQPKPSTFLPEDSEDGNLTRIITQPTPLPNSVFFHLPKLCVFRFSSGGLFSRYHDRTNKESEPCPNNCQDPRYMHTLLELLQQRCGKNSPYIQQPISQTRSEVIEITRDQLPLQARMREFRVKFQCDNLGESDESLSSGFRQLGEEIELQLDIKSATELWDSFMNIEPPLGI